MTDDEGSILVIAPMVTEAEGHQCGLLSSADVPLEALKKGLQVVLSDIEELLAGAEEALGRVHVQHVDVSLGIRVDGSVGILGSGVSAGANGGVTIRFTLG